MTSPTIGHYNEIAVWLRLALFTNANRVHRHLEAFSNPYQKHFTVNCVVHIHIHIKSTLQLCGSYPYQKHFTTAWSISNPYQKHLTTVWSISISISKALYSVVLDAKPSHHCPEAWKVFVGFCAYRCITKLSFKVYIKQKLPEDAMSISQKYLNTIFASTTTPISEIHFTD